LSEINPLQIQAKKL